MAANEKEISQMLADSTDETDNKKKRFLSASPV
jgi:hypothetical protein